MISRFQGKSNLHNLLETIKTNRLVEHNDELAKRLASEGQLLEYLVTDRIIEQGNYDRDLFLILTGSVRIFVNGRLVGTRGNREIVGEMALIDATAMRSATVIPSTTVVVLKVPEPVFYSIAHDYPRMFKPIAETIAERLRERSKFHRTPNSNPILFIGSSVEGLSIAEHIHLGFNHDREITSEVWTHGIFGPTKTALDTLMRKAKESDFAAFVFAPDDKISSRDHDYFVPRDNVVFELGLFLNELGPDRTFIIQAIGSDLKIPSDLLGITPITYKHEGIKNINSAAATVCTQLRDVIRVQGVR